METATETRELKVGDRIYCESYGLIHSIYTIERITPTQAVSGTTKFKRELSKNGYAYMIGERGFSSYLYWIETPELIKKHIRQQSLSKIGNTNFKSFSDEKIQQIINIINS